MNRSRLFLIALCAALGLALGGGASAEAESDLRELAERLVGSWGAPGEMRIVLEPGAVPEDVDVELPLPEEFRLVGSLTRFERDRMVSLQVVLDGPERTSQAFDALRRSFEEAGWAYVADEPMGGFVATAPALFGRACPPTDDETERRIAYVSALPLFDGRSDVRVDLSPDAWEGACAPHEQPHHLAGSAPLPTLAAPEGGEIGNPLVTHGSEEALAQAVLRGTTDDEEAVVRHYERELAEAGWSATGDGLEHDFGVRQRWAFTDEAGVPWIGVLAIEWPARTGPVMLSFTVVAEPAP